MSLRMICNFIIGSLQIIATLKARPKFRIHHEIEQIEVEQKKISRDVEICLFVSLLEEYFRKYCFVEFTKWSSNASVRTFGRPFVLAQHQHELYQLRCAKNAPLCVRCTVSQQVEYQNSQYRRSVCCTKTSAVCVSVVNCIEQATIQTASYLFWVPCRKID